MSTTAEINTTLSIMRQQEAIAKEAAAAEYWRYVLLAAQGVALTDPDSLRAVLRDNDCSIDDYERDVRQVAGRQKMFDEIAAAAEAQKAAERFDFEMKEVVAELRRVAAPLQQRIADLERARDEKLKEANRTSQHNQRLAATAPEWIEPERRRSGQRVTAARERIASLNESLQRANVELHRVDGHIANLQAIIRERDKGLTSNAADHLHEAAAARQRSLDSLQGDRRYLKQRRDDFHQEISNLKAEIERLEARNRLLDNLAMTALWPTPSDLEDAAA